MKNRLLLLVLALTLMFPVASLRAADPQPGAAPAPKDDETELGKTMSKLNGAWRKLRKQIADPANNASSLELVATVKAAAVQSLTLKPAKVEDVPAADREKFVADYQAQMKTFIATADQLESALKANDNTGAQAIMQKMGGMQKEGHKEFKRPEH